MRAAALIASIHFCFSSTVSAYRKLRVVVGVWVQISGLSVVSSRVVRNICDGWDIIPMTHGTPREKYINTPLGTDFPS